MRYDCLVLSGGGAKGAYGAGVAKGLADYRALRSLSNPICYIGTSAGALNAAILAAHGPEALISFWLGATHRTMLGVRIRSTRIRGLMRRIAMLFDGAMPFHLYPNDALRAVLSRDLSLDRLAAAHLIVTATNFTSAQMESFYLSPLLDTVKQYDDALGKLKQRRLQHFRRIDTDQQLVDCLLASSAYPGFFPPVKIGNDLYVDGGVGNHTPTREAAYFFRYLAELKAGEPGEVYCVKQDPPRTLATGASLTLTEILMRTFDVYHHIHMEPIIRAWFRINTEMRHLEERTNEFRQWLRTQDVPDELFAEIARRVQEEVIRLGGATQRREIPMLEIEPSAPLGDTFGFDPGHARMCIATGHIDMLKALREKQRIDDLEYKHLSNARLWA